MEDAVVLRIGDYITLKNVRYNNIIVSEGILGNELYLSNNLMQELDDMIFCVHLKRQYSTALELKVAQSQLYLFYY